MEVVSGSISQGDIQGGTTACTAIAMAACGFTTIMPVIETWTVSNIDKIVRVGVHLYLKSLEQFGENVNNIYLRPDEVTRQVSFRGCHDSSETQVSFDVAENTIIGTLQQGEMSQEDLRNLTTDVGFYDLQSGLAEFFQNNATGVFITCGYSIALIKGRNAYWVFDSHKRNNDGLCSQFGNAVLLKFLSIDEVANHIRRLYSNSAYQFEIIGINVNNDHGMEAVGTLNVRPNNTKEPVNVEETIKAYVPTESKKSLHKNKKTKKAINAEKIARMNAAKAAVRMLEKENVIPIIHDNRFDVLPEEQNYHDMGTVGTKKVTSNNTIEPVNVEVPVTIKAQVHADSKKSLRKNKTSKKEICAKRVATMNAKKGKIRMLQKNKMVQPIEHDNSFDVLSVEENSRKAIDRREINKLRCQLWHSERKEEVNKEKRLKIEHGRKCHLEKCKRRLEGETAKQINLERAKRRLQINETAKQINLERAKRRLQINETAKKNNLENTKRRFERNETAKQQNKDRSAKRSRQMMKDDSFRLTKNKQNIQYVHKVRANANSVEGLRENFKIAVKEGPIHICYCCGQLKFKKAVVFKDVKKLTDYAKNIWDETRPHVDFEHNETYCIFCKTCNSYLIKRRTPPSALINGIGFKSMPNVLRGLNQMEERLISARIPFMQIRNLGIDKQFGLKGPCINIPVNVNNTVTLLPRRLTETETVQVKLLRRMSDKNHYAFDNVRPEKVFAAAKYLTDTPLYKKHGISLDEQWLNEFNQQINTVNEEMDSGEAAENMSSDTQNIENNNNYDTEQNNTAESVENIWIHEPLTAEENAINNQETLLTSLFIPDTGIKIAPGEGQIPISILGDSDLDGLAFPTIYGGQLRNFKRKFTPSQIAKIEANSYDRRVATNFPKLAMNFCRSRAHKLSGQINIALRKKRHTSLKVTDVLNGEKLDTLIHHNDGFRVIAADRASPAFWESKKRTLMAMLRQCGPASFFITFSAAESRWKELLIILKKVLHNENISINEASGMAWFEKIKLIQSDPVTCAKYFDHRFSEFWKYMKAQNGPFRLFEILYHYIRYEIQHRGSIHAHCMSWNKDAPKLDMDNVQSLRECEEFIDQFITCKKDDSLGETLNCQYHKHSKSCKKKRKQGFICRFGFPKPPMRKTMILLPLNFDTPTERLEQLKNTYKYIVKETEKIAKSNEDCTFDDYLKLLNINENDYILAVRSKVQKATVYLKRNLNERKINNYNREMLSLWEANMDIQFILDPYACVMYVINYINKSQRGMSKLLRDVAENIEGGNQSLGRQMRKVVNAYVHNSEVSAQEIVCLTNGIRMSQCSLGEVFINTSRPEERTRLLKSKTDLNELRKLDPDSTNITEAGLLEHYVERPEDLENVSLADFAALYNFSSKKSKNTNAAAEDDDDDDCEYIAQDNIVEANRFNKLEMRDGSGFISQRRQSRIIRFRNFKLSENEMEYYREQAMLFTAWRNEEEILKDPKNAYMKNIKLIKMNRRPYYDGDEGDTFEAILENAANKEHDQESSDEEEGVELCSEYLAFLPEPGATVDIVTEINAQIDHNVQDGTFLLPSLIPEDKYLEIVGTLNERQRKYFLNIVYSFKTKPDEQFFHFISGGAGVGKSRLIKAITQALNRYWIHRIENNPDDLFVLLCAFTGKAAYNINGVTCHSAFHLGFREMGEDMRNRKLNADTKSTLICKYRKLKLIIIDEISMISSEMLHLIDRRLQDIFDNSKPFGGVSIIVLGDFNQLPPVQGSPVYRAEKDPISIIAGAYLWNNFQLYELTEIMRQKDDVNFALALNNLAVGKTSQQDDELFRSREMTRLGLDENSIIDDAIGLFSSNQAVDSYNEMCLQLMSGNEPDSEAFDVCEGKGSQMQKENALRFIKNRHYTKTQALASFIKLRVGARYMLTVNINTRDGLTNGAIGILKSVKYGLTTAGIKTPRRLYLFFEDPIIGSETRQSSIHLIRNDKVDDQWTPIERIVKSITISAGSPLIVLRNQFPLVCAQACTIHKSQGSSLNKIIVDLVPTKFTQKSGRVIEKKLNLKLMYTAFSRATSASGLFIRGHYEPPAALTKSSAQIEMDRLRNEAQLAFSLKFPEEYKSVDNVLCIFQNVRSLNAHFSNIKNDLSFKKADILMFVETWTKPTDNVQLKDFTCIHRRDCIMDRRHAFGSILYAKSNNNISLLFETCETDVREGHLHSYSDFVGFKIHNYGILFLYKSPKMNVASFLSSLKKCLDKFSTANISNIVLVGDFNVDYFSNDQHCIVTYLKDMSLSISIDRNVPSTEQGTLIDWCFSNCVNGYVFESTISDHKPIWFTLNDSIPD